MKRRMNSACVTNLLVSFGVVLSAVAFAAVMLTACGRKETPEAAPDQIVSFECEEQDESTGFYRKVTLTCDPDTGVMQGTVVSQESSSEKSVESTKVLTEEDRKEFSSLLAEASLKELSIHGSSFDEQKTTVSIATENGTHTYEYADESDISEAEASQIKALRNWVIGKVEN